MAQVIPNGLQTLLAKHEGVETKMYKDSKGINTIGIGHNLDANPISNAAVTRIFNDDIQETLEFLNGYSWFGSLGDARKSAVADMCFNLGSEGFSKFTGFLGFLAAENFQAAAQDLRATEVYKELPKRYEELSQLIETGVI